MYGYPANATVQWSSPGEEPDTAHLAVIAASVAAAVFLVLVIISMAACSTFWARRRIAHKNCTRGQVMHSTAALDREHLLPGFANAANGDMV